MNFYTFIKCLEDFLDNQEDRNKILDIIENMEDELILKKKYYKDNFPDEIEILNNAMNIVCDIHILIDEMDILPEEKLKENIQKLAELQHCQERKDKSLQFSLENKKLEFFTEPEVNQCSSGKLSFSADKRFALGASKELNLNFLRKNMILQKNIEYDANKDEVREFMDKIMELIPEDNFITKTYVIIIEKISEFIDKNAGIEEVEEIFKETKHKIENAVKEYGKYYISPDEWTIETAAGHRFLMEGLMEYKNAIVSMENSLNFSMIEKEDIERMFEANKKLVATQYLAEYVKKITKSSNPLINYAG